MSQKTAMKALIDYMEENFHLTDESFAEFKKYLEKEKEQIETAFNDATKIKWKQVSDLSFKSEIRTGRDYFNETFKNEDGINISYNNDVELTDDILLNLGFKYWIINNEITIKNATPLTLCIGNITLRYRWDNTCIFISDCTEGNTNDLSHITKQYQLELLLFLYTGKHYPI